MEGKKITNVDDMYREIKRKSKDFGNDISLEERKKYRDMSFDDYNTELEKEIERNGGRKGLCKQDEEDLQKQLDQVILGRKLDQMETAKRLDKEKSENIIMIDSNELKLPKLLSQFGEDCQRNMFVYFPKQLSLFYYHPYVQEISDFYITRYIYDQEYGCEYNEYGELVPLSGSGGYSITEEIVAANSCGLGFRKVYYAGCDGDYFVIFFNYFDRTDDIKIKEIRSNKKLIDIVEYNEFTKGYDPSIEGLDNMVLPGEENDARPLDEEEIPDSEKYNKTPIERRLKYDKANPDSFVYKHIMVMMVYKVTLVPIDMKKKRECVILSPERCGTMRGMFQFLQFITFNDD